MSFQQDSILKSLKAIIEFILQRKMKIIISFLIICAFLLSSERISTTNAQSYTDILQQSTTSDDLQKKYQEYLNTNNQIDEQKATTNLGSQYDTKTDKFQKFEKDRFPELLNKAEMPISNIEKMFNDIFMEELDEPIRQYGYDFFKDFISEKFLPVGNNYTVGPGDNIFLYFWGDPVDILKLNGFYSLSIDRDGKIFIPNLGVFYVWSLTVPKVKKIIHKAMSKKFKRFEIDVTLGKLREFPVYISGFVKRPGIILTSGTSNILDVLSLAGGVAKSGSLRNILLKRKDKNGIKEICLDLYDLFIEGTPAEIQIKEGDSILVNPIGNTTGLTGAVKRPGIYELTKNRNTIEKFINIAGGALASVYSPGIRLYRYENNILNIYEGSLDDSSFLNKRLKDGDLIYLNSLYNLVENEMIVKGHVAYPGKYSHKSGLKLSQLMRSIGMLPDTNLFSAEIRRHDENKIINFSPKSILEGKSDFKLKKMDIINFYPRWIFKPILVSGELNNPCMIPFYNGITLLDVLKQVDLKKPARKLKAEIFEEYSMDIEKDEHVYSDNKDTNNEDVNSKLTIGKKLKTVYLYDLLIRATKESNIELSEGATVLLRPTEPTEKNKIVTLLGEVNKPGVYNFKAGMTLHDLLNECEGYTEDAYPRGLIFIRKSAMRLQKEQIEMSLLSMKEYLAGTAGETSGSGSAEERAMLQMMVQQHGNMIALMEKKSEMALGRIAIDIPKKIEDLKESSNNITLTENDYIFIPPKPNYILVLGSVYNQMSLPYENDKSVSYYLSQLGGANKNADEDDMYIIKANGKIISKQQFSSLSSIFGGGFENEILEEGDTIVVPVEFKVPIMWRSILKDITQIMFQSVSTVAIATKLE